MSRIATSVFERKMRQDNDFALEVHFHQLLIKGIRYVGFCRNTLSESADE